MTLCAGVARSDITPPVGIAHAGWGAQTHERARGVDLPLWGTALAFDDGESRALIVDLDLVYVWDPDATRIRERISELTSLPVSAIRLSYTHTHSGPFIQRESWIDDGSEMVETYLDALPDLIAGAAWEAVNSLQPVNLAAGTGDCGIAVNRRFARPEDGRLIVGTNPDGPVDHDVGVVRLDTPDGDTVAVLGHYACHPTTVGPDNDLITPDFPGVAKRIVEDTMSTTCLFLQGAAGNVGPIRGTARGGIDEYESLGRRLGHEIAQVSERLDPLNRATEYVETLESGAPLAVYDDRVSPTSPSVSINTSELTLPIKELPALEEVQECYTQAQERIDQLDHEDATEHERRTATMRAKRAKITRDLVSEFGGLSELTFELQIFQLGDLALVAMPGEPFVETALRIKAESPFEYTFFSGYSNIGHCYIPTAQAYDDGGYEVDRTPVKAGAVDIIVQETLDQLRSLKTPD